MASLYAFKSNVKKYPFKNQELECVMAYFNAFLSIEDIGKLFGQNKDNLTEQIKTFYNTILNENEVHYTFIDWENNQTEYYNLDVIYLLNEKNHQENVVKFLLWANRKLKSYLIKQEYNQSRMALRNVSDEIDLRLPKYKKEPKSATSTSLVYAKEKYKK